jgi:Asp-tRNA(Asn)/Glu-tRNA(Gln) amidotransferase A subunit family amidase
MSHHNAKTRALSASDLELCYMPASELLQRFRARQLSPVEVLKAQIKRYEAIGGKVNCVTYTHFDEALQAAQESERRYQQGNPRALEGITVGVKDEDGLAGWTVTAGSVLLKDNKLEHNTPVADKLIEAGAVMHLQTTVPEFYAHACTWSKLWGVTRNPWNLHYSVGGSSGGSGAALAAGLTTLATGSDMGGSIRIPASLNGLYGFKPPHGRVPVVPGDEIMPQSTSGPIARTLQDLALFQTVLCGPHPGQMSALRPKLDYPTSYPDIKGWRIAYSPNQGWAQIDPDVERNTKAALKILEQQGAIVEQVELNWNGSEIITAVMKSLLATGMGSMLAPFMDPSLQEQMTSYGRYFIKIGQQALGAKQLAQAQAYAAERFREYDDLFAQGFRAFICPTTATNRVPADFDPVAPNATLTINGVSVNPLTGWALTSAFNLMYTIPVVNVPTGFDSNHVPTGMQIAARSYDDLVAFQTAAAYAQAAPRFSTGELFPDFREW